MMMSRLFYLTVLAATLCACTITASDDVYTTPKPIITQPTSTVVVPAAIINEKKDDVMYVCTLKAFTSTYKSENESKGKAKLSVKKQCLNEFNEMFCQDKDIKCSEYK